MREGLGRRGTKVLGRQGDEGGRRGTKVDKVMRK